MRYKRVPEILLLVHRLSNLLATTSRAIFVWDGPARPQRKRDKTVSTQPHWFIEAFKTLVKLFGFLNVDVSLFVPTGTELVPTVSSRSCIAGTRGGRGPISVYAAKRHH